MKRRLRCERDGRLSGETLCDVLAEFIGEGVFVTSGVEEDDQSIVITWIEESVGGVAASAAVVPVAVGCFDMKPVECDAGSTRHVSVDLLRGVERVGEGFALRSAGGGSGELVGMELGFEVGEHVGCCGADAAGSGEGIEIPGVGGIVCGVVAFDEAGSHGGS